LAKIIVLDEVTANQIAAGEVVERPASVVKELLENSFDAGATRVTVEITGGGMDMITVSDNGCGMDEADAATAFSRHATSKINSIDDLEEICSLGFRGEALPSIASVSKTRLTTREHHVDSGTILEIAGGKILSVSSAGCPPGTTVSVAGLFFNTPARLKYMKSKSAEAGQISEISSRLALARPDIAVKLISDGRTVFSTTGSGLLRDALAAVYGANAARQMLEINASENGVTVSGLIGPPSLNRSNKRHITVIINGRYVRSPLAGTAATEGYSTFLPTGRYPLAVIKIDLAPRLLDVNVHPAKMNVRFAGEVHLFNLIKRAVTAGLLTDRVVPGLGPAGHGHNAVENISLNFSHFQRPGEVKKTTSSVPPGMAAFETADKYPAGYGEIKDLPIEKGNLLDSIYPIGFLPPTYILAGSSAGLCIIDQHAAHERILFEKYLAALSKGETASQILAVPLIIQLSPGEYQAAEQYRDVLASAGIGAESFGPGALAVRELPAGMPARDAEELVRDMLERLIASGGTVVMADLVKDMAASAACRAAVKAGTKSSLEEARTLIADLAETGVPYTCPHGRPTIVNITDQELKSRFKRT